MGHGKTASLVDRLYSGNSKDKHCSPPKKVKKDETVENNEKVLKYLEDSLAVFESKVQEVIPEVEKEDTEMSPVGSPIKAEPPTEQIEIVGPVELEPSDSVQNI